MAQKIITIDIDKEAGTFSVDTAGFKGTGCKAIHEAFSRMGKVTKETIKPEYYEKPNGTTVSNGQ